MRYLVFPGLVIPEHRFVAASHEPDGTTLVQYETASHATASERIPGHVERFTVIEDIDSPLLEIGIPSAAKSPDRPAVMITSRLGVSA